MGDSFTIAATQRDLLQSQSGVSGVLELEVTTYLTAAIETASLKYHTKLKERTVVSAVCSSSYLLNKMYDTVHL